MSFRINGVKTLNTPTLPDAVTFRSGARLAGKHSAIEKKLGTDYNSVL